MTVQPRAGVAALKVRLSDGAGELMIVFVGRRHIAGLELGAFMSVTGVLGAHAG